MDENNTGKRSGSSRKLKEVVRTTNMKVKQSSSAGFSFVLQ